MSPTEIQANTAKLRDHALPGLLWPTSCDRLHVNLYVVCGSINYKPKRRGFLESICHNRSHISVARFRSNVLVLPVHCCTEFSE